MQIDLKSKPDGRHPKIEKYILRKAFDTPEQPYLPDNVLYRQKEAFSDGVGYSWVDGLKAYAESVCAVPNLTFAPMSSASLECCSILAFRSHESRLFPPEAFAVAHSSARV